MIKPIDVTDDEARAYLARPPLLMRLGQLWANHAPRGKGSVPRYIGQRFGRGWRTSIVTAAGARLAVAPRHLDFYAGVVRLGGWNPEIPEACLAVLRAGDVFYDIGANAGYVSVTVASRQREITVVAFEPQPDLARAAALSAKLNGLDRMRVYPLLLGDADGTAELYVPAHGIHASMHKPDAPAERHELPIRRLDNLIADGTLPPPDVIKIDVEGAEEMVFAGAAEMFKTRPPCVLAEAYPGRQRAMMNELAARADYSFVGVTTGGLIPADRTREDDRFTDVLAVTPGRWPADVPRPAR